MISLNQITAADWSLALDWTIAPQITFADLDLVPDVDLLGDVDSLTTAAANGAGLGNVVQGIADVDQCLAIILTTPKGSDVLRPTFGADLWQYVDRPIDAAIPAIVREVTDAILLWEPRIQLVSVTAAVIRDGGAQTGAKLAVTVAWRLKLGTPVNQTTVTIGRKRLA